MDKKGKDTIKKSDFTNLSTKKRILDTSISLFSKSGYDGTSIEDIAQAAGITKSLIYYHFKNKKAILHELIHDFIEHSLVLKTNLLNQIVKDKNIDPAEIFNTIFNFLEFYKDLIQIFYYEVLKNPDDEVGFHFIDINFDKAIDLLEGHGFKINNPIDFSLIGFFLGIMPLVNFTMLNNLWCKYYKQDPEEIKKLFMKTFMDIYLTVLEKIIVNGNQFTNTMKEKIEKI